MFSARSPFPSKAVGLLSLYLLEASHAHLVTTRGAEGAGRKGRRGGPVTGEEEGEATAADCIEEIVAHLVALNSNQRLETCIHAVPADFVSTVSVKCE